jgi:hypothetical protein
MCELSLTQPRLHHRSDIELLEQMRTRQSPSQGGRRSLREPVRGPAQTAVARGTTSPSAASGREQEPVRGLREQSRPGARCLRPRYWLVEPGIASRTAASSPHSRSRWLWPLALLAALLHDRLGIGHSHHSEGNLRLNANRVAARMREPPAGMFNARLSLVGVFLAMALSTPDTP